MEFNIRIDKKGITALTLIFSGLLLLQSWWIARSSVSKADMEVLMSKAIEPIRVDLSAIRERGEIHSVTLLNIDMRLKELEPDVSEVNRNVIQGNNKMGEITPALDSLSKLIRDVLFWQPKSNFTKITPKPPPKLERRDSLEIERIRRQRLPYLQPLDFVIPYTNNKNPSR